MGVDERPPGDRGVDWDSGEDMQPTRKPPKPTSPQQALERLEALHGLATKGEAKPSALWAILDDAATVTALVAAPYEKVRPLLRELRDVRGFARPVDLLIARCRKIRTALDAEGTTGDEATREALEVDGSGETASKYNQANAAKVFQLDPFWTGRLRLNEHSRRYHLDEALISDGDEVRAALYLINTYGIKLSPAAVGEVMRTTADTTPFHPVRDWLGTLEWDGVERAATWLIDYCGSPDKRIVRAYCKRFLISAVARVHEPGVQCDTTLILQGKQGAQKSKALRALCGDPWFRDTAVDLRNKDAMQALHSGVWIYEFAELDTIARSELTLVKSFLSSRVDSFRPPYGRNVIDYPRQVVIVGSSNEDTFLRDPTGSRRFWPVQTGSIDLAGLTDARTQLWAEAVHLYRDGEQWHLTPEEEGGRIASEHLFTEVDAWEDAVLHWLGRAQPAEVRLVEVWEKALDGRGNNFKQHCQKRISAILRRGGWTKHHTMRGKVWREPKGAP